MRGNELLDKMELIDPKYIETAEIEYRNSKAFSWRWIWIAVCMCFAVVAFAAISGKGHKEPSLLPVPSPNGTMERTEEPDAYPPVNIIPDLQIDEPPEININKADGFMDGARKYIPGYFTEELSKDQIERLMHRPDWGISCTGYAGFDAEGTLVDIFIDAVLSQYPDSVTVNISRSESSRCYETSFEPVKSIVNGQEFFIYEYKIGKNRKCLDAFTERNGLYFAFYVETTGGSNGEEINDLSTMLQCFSGYNEGEPNVDFIVPKEIPEYFDRKITLDEALQDKLFGRYMLNNPPNGFSAESIRRYKDQNNDYLSGLWTRGYDELSWKITFFSDEDTKRITDIDKTENYDLSLYPIPRAQSVPEELREIVEDPIFLAEELTKEAVYARAYKTGETGDSDGWRMKFCIKYEGMLISISSKGVGPEWLFEQITDICV